MRWDDIPATSVAKSLSIPVLFNITDTFIEEHIDALHVGRFSAVGGIWKDISIKANTDAQLTGFLQVGLEFRLRIHIEFKSPVLTN